MLPHVTDVSAKKAANYREQSIKLMINIYLITTLLKPDPSVSAQRETDCQHELSGMRTRLEDESPASRKKKQIFLLKTFCDKLDKSVSLRSKLKRRFFKAILGTFSLSKILKLREREEREKSE